MLFLIRGLQTQMKIDFYYDNRCADKDMGTKFMFLFSK